MKERGGDHESYLLRLLERGAHTRRSLEERLLRRGADGTEIAALLGRFEALGYIDDGLYARLYVEGHGDRGKRRLRDDLRRRGVAEATIAAVLEEKDDEEEAAFGLALQWHERGVESRLIAGRLLRRGFPPALVRSLLDRLERKAP